jgi:ATP-dependent Clp protease ATP-binding subunit ClpC
MWIDELDRQASVATLKGLRAAMEAHHRMAIDDRSVEAAVDLAIRYLPGLRLPDKAIDILDQACAQVRTTNGGDSTCVLQLTPRLLARVVAEQCHLSFHGLEEIIQRSYADNSRSHGG